MSRKINYVGPNCGRHVDDEPTLWQIVMLVLSALLLGVGAVAFIILAFSL